MAEAAEIAKLRLFLKLAAQLDGPAQIEPLPDLDFNIKSGNLLVGIADRDDITRRFSERGVLPFGLEEIEDAVESIAVAYEQFVAIQDSTDDQHVLQQAKGSLQNRIDAVADQADRGLHKMRGETAPLEEWKESHAPFHWFIEFPTVWRNNGFDVIIGNPPYIRVRGKGRNQLGYKWIGYESDECPDLYAACAERASNLLNCRGRFAMIVMLSLCFDKDFRRLREHLQDQLPSLWVSAYSRIPDGLFSGSARVRNTIVVASRTSDLGLSTSRCRRWLSAARSHLFATQRYVKPSSPLLRCGVTPQWPLVDDPCTAAAFVRMIEELRPLDAMVNKSGEFKIGFRPTAQYMLGVFVEEPPTVDPDTELPVAGKPSVWLNFEDDRQRDLALLSLAGCWGYLWWLLYGDEFDVTRGVLAALPCDIERLAASLYAPSDIELGDLVARLLELADRLKTEMPKHLAWKVNAGKKIGRYNMLKMRHITDEADWLLAQAWGLTREQYEAAGNLRDRMTFGNRA